MNGNSHIWHRGLDILADLAWLAVEIPLFLPADVLTVRVRDAVIPRMVKKRLPFLSCRRYNGFDPRVDCGPAEKYRHGGLFRVVVCAHYDLRSGECRRRKPREARRSQADTGYPVKEERNAMKDKKRTIVLLAVLGLALIAAVVNLTVL